MTSPITISKPLLSHPWYQKWECGHLPVESLRHYAGQYYWQVANFPRYLSGVHTRLENLSDRQVILRNLMDEENAESPHPELWLDFAEAMGCDREAVKAAEPGPAARALVDEFHAIVASSPEAGLGAMLAYESQVPAVAKFKSEALEKHYLAKDQVAAGAKFFAVHREADVWHTEELQGLVAKLPEEKRRTAQKAADRAADALWKFLDAMPN